MNGRMIVNMNWEKCVKLVWLIFKYYFRNLPSGCGKQHRKAPSQ